MPTRNLSHHQHTSDAHEEVYTNDHAIYLKFLREKGDEAFEQKNFNKAIEWYKTFIQTSEYHDDSITMSIILSSIANCYASLGKYDQAEQYYKLATIKLTDDTPRRANTVQPMNAFEKIVSIYVFTLRYVFFLWEVLILYWVMTVITKPSLLPFLEVYVLVHFIAIYISAIIGKKGFIRFIRICARIVLSMKRSVRMFLY